MDQSRQAVTSKTMKAIDRRASDVYGVASIVLMENAGRGAAEEILKALRKKSRPQVVLVCGTGNNGGDGFVATRHLIIHGVRPQVFLLGSEAQLKGDAAVNCDILKRMGMRIRCERPTANALTRADIVVDAIFGIGLNRQIEGQVAEVIDDMNRWARKIFSLDVPSGLDATSGKIHGVCVKAHRTITFYAPKTGMLRASGPDYTGKTVVKHIGI